MPIWRPWVSSPDAIRLDVMEQRVLAALQFASPLTPGALADLLGESKLRIVNAMVILGKHHLIKPLALNRFAAEREWIPSPAGQAFHTEVR